MICCRYCLLLLLVVVVVVVIFVVSVTVTVGVLFWGLFVKQPLVIIVVDC